MSPNAERLHAILARMPAGGAMPGGVPSAANLARALHVSVPTLHRALAELGDRVVAIGRARRARYALRRALRGHAEPLPLFEVDRDGRAAHVGDLALLYPQGSLLTLEADGWPLPEDARDGFWPGLPYMLYDMRAQGYMGRQFARAEHAHLGVAANPDAWSDDDVAWVLSQTGADASGSLIVGAPAYQRWLATRQGGAAPLKPRATARAYARLAEQAVAAGVAGSSAAGEFPKFTALRERAGSATPHVLVKFSGADDSAAVRRWSDLLVCEHLALAAAATMPDIASATSRILIHAGRTFLEVERFDRHGMYGRSRLASLAMIDAAFLGAGSTDWRHLAARLVALRVLPQADAARIERLWWFGRLIANTDMHTGNVSFVAARELSLAPTYDMVPMLYAPLAGGEVPVREFAPPLPLPQERAVWLEACGAALGFWDAAAVDIRISQGFRQVSSANAARLREAAGHA